MPSARNKLVAALAVTALLGVGGALAGTSAQAGGNPYRGLLEAPRVSRSHVTVGSTLTVSGTNCVPGADPTHVIVTLTSGWRDVATVTTDPSRRGTWTADLTIAASVHPGLYLVVSTCDTYVDEQDYVPVPVHVAPLASDPSEMDSSRLVITAPLSGIFGHRTVIGGVLIDTTSFEPVSDATLTLQDKQAGDSGFTTLRTVTTGRFGVALAAVTPDQNASYRWVFAGSPSVQAATSHIVSSDVEYDVNLSTVDGKGRSLVAYGTALPAKVGSKITLQRKVHDRWSTLRTTKVKKLKVAKKSLTGYAFDLSGLGKGKYTVRTICAGSAHLRSGVSAVTTIHVG